MYKNIEITLPLNFQEDINKAINILKKSGCTDIFLFGSIVEEKIKENSDIDIAVRGCPQGQFFPLLGELLLSLNRSVDLVNLDNKDPFSQYLEREGRLVKIA